MTKIDQYEVLRKIRNRLKCESFGVMAGMLGTDSSVITNIKKGKYKISHRLFLNAAIALDISPKKLIEEVGLPEYYFLEKRRHMNDD